MISVFEYTRRITKVYLRHASKFIILPVMLMLLVGLLAPAGGMAQVEIQPETGAVAWTIYQVDAPKFFTKMTNRSMRFDSNGYPHIAYGGDALYYVYWNGSMWIYSVVDSSPNVGAHASLALDNSNRPRISYYDADAVSLKFAYYTGANWVVNTIDTPATTPLPLAGEEGAPEPASWDESAWLPGFSKELLNTDQPTAPTSGGVGQYNSIVVDTNNQVHISYYDADNGLLKYAFWNGISWTKEIVDGQNGDAGKFTSIVVNANNRPAISYMDEKYDNLKYAYKTCDGTGCWDTSIIEGDSIGEVNDVGPYTSLILDGAGKPHVSYFDFGRTALKYATPDNSGGWAITTVDNSGNVGWDTSIGISSGGTLFISYYDASNANLKYATKSGNNWGTYTLYSEGDVGRFTSTAYNKDNWIGISFFVPGDGRLIYTYWDGKQWTASNIDYSGDVGLSTSLDIASGDNPHISYFNDTGDSLKYASRFGGLWNLTTLPGQSIGNYSSLKLDQAGLPRIAYYDLGNQDLKYAYWDAGKGEWIIQYIHQTDDAVGKYVSMDLDTLGRPHVSYYDESEGDLLYAFWTGSFWSIQEVDTAGDVGYYTSIYVDNANRPYIAYHDGTNNDLKFAYLSPIDAWVTETVDSAGDLGEYASLGMDSFGQPHISYYDDTNQDLKYAVKLGGAIGGAWLIETVDSVGQVGEYTSLAVGGDGNPRISYYDATNGDLKYAARIAGNWGIEIVDSWGNVGQFSSLALNSSGLPGISYYDATGGDLKLAASFPLPTPQARLFLPVAIK